VLSPHTKLIKLITQDYEHLIASAGELWYVVLLKTGCFSNQSKGVNHAVLEMIITELTGRGQSQ
jgi:hypothetical protein